MLSKCRVFFSADIFSKSKEKTYLSKNVQFLLSSLDSIDLQNFLQHSLLDALWLPFFVEIRHFFPEPHFTIITSRLLLILQGNINVKKSRPSSCSSSRANESGKKIPQLVAWLIRFQFILNFHVSGYLYNLYVQYWLLLLLPSLTDLSTLAFPLPLPPLPSLLPPPPPSHPPLPLLAILIRLFQGFFALFTYWY